MKKILIAAAVAVAGLLAALPAQAQFVPTGAYTTYNTQCGTYFKVGSNYFDSTGANVGTALPFCAGSMSTQNAGSAQIQPTQYTVATLPTCNSFSKALLLVVTDATSPTYNAALTGGGAVVVPVFCNGSSWTSH